MAADWIKIEHSLPGKPEVMELARILGIDEMCVVGHLVCFWSWVDQNMSPDCPQTKGTKKGLDRVCGRDGFVDAMVQVGWLQFDGENVTIPNYDHHLSESAKKRASEARKKRNQRSRPPSCPAADGTKTGQHGDKKGDQRREEKRRDIEIETPAKPKDPWDEFGGELIIPQKLRTDEVRESVKLWFEYLDEKSPEKRPPRNSPQMQSWWAEANRLGSKLIDSIQFSMARGYFNITERPPDYKQQAPSRSKRSENEERIKRLIESGN